VQGSRRVSHGEADEQSRNAEDDGDCRRTPPADSPAPVDRRPVAALLQNVRTSRLAAPRRVIWPPSAFILAAHLVMISGAGATAREDCCPRSLLSWLLRPLYSSSMQSSQPSSLLILLVIVLLAAGYFIGRKYVNSRRFNRRKWK